MIELLVVMGVMAVLAVLVTPMTGSLIRGNKINAAVLKVSTTLDDAKAYAVAHQSYVWVGFLEEDDNVFLAVATTGKVADFSVPPRAVRKIQRVEGIKLSAPSAMSTQYRSAANDGEWGEELAENAFGTVGLNVGGQTKNFNRWILLTPRGETLTTPGTLSRWVAFGIEPAVGGAANGAIFQINGITSKCLPRRL